MATAVILGLLALCQTANGELRVARGKRTVHRRVAQVATQREAQVEPESILIERPMPHRSHPGSHYVDGPVEFELSGGDCQSCGGCSPCGGCAPRCGIYGSAEYLMWWRRGQSVPVLASSSPQGTARGAAGVLGGNGTTSLFGGERVAEDSRPGVRLTLGRWLLGSDVIGVEGRFYTLNDVQIDFNPASQGDPIIARPFFNTATNLQDALLIAFPNVSVGSMNIQGSSELHGGDVLFRGLLNENPCGRVDLVVGYQYARLDEDLVISSTSTNVEQGGNLPVGAVSQVTDAFRTRNEYHAATVGLECDWHYRRFQFNVLGKLGLGRMNQQVQIDGSSVISAPGQAAIAGNGLLALPTNEGLFEQRRFSVSPEINANVVFQITPCLDLTAGYSLLHWNRMVRPGDQIDLAVNPTQITGALVGPARPAFNFQESKFWVQGVNVGVQGRF